MQSLFKVVKGFVQILQLCPVSETIVAILIGLLACYPLYGQLSGLTHVLSVV